MIHKTKTQVLFAFLSLVLLITETSMSRAAALVLAPERYGEYQIDSKESGDAFKNAFDDGNIRSIEKLLVFNAITPKKAETILGSLAGQDWTEKQSGIADLVSWMRRDPKVQRLQEVNSQLYSQKIRDNDLESMRQKAEIAASVLRLINIVLTNPDLTVAQRATLELMKEEPQKIYDSMNAQRIMRQERYSPSSTRAFIPDTPRLRTPETPRLRAQNSPGAQTPPEKPRSLTRAFFPNSPVLSPASPAPGSPALQSGSDSDQAGAAALIPLTPRVRTKDLIPNTPRGVPQQMPHMTPQSI